MIEHDKLPADALPLSIENIWAVIRSQKDLNLPAHKVRWEGLGLLGAEVVGGAAPGLHAPRT